MYIEIIKPFQSSGIRTITLDNITITFQEDEVNELFEKLDNELHYKTTREDLQKTINELEDELNEMLDEDERTFNEMNG